MTRRHPDAPFATCMLAVWAMGTRFELLLAGDDEPFLRAAGEAAIADIEDAHARLTAFESDSVVASINAAPPGQPVRVDGEVFGLLRLAERVRERSGGAFDIGYRSENAGPAIALDEHDSCVIRRHETARIDLGSIGKGFALDLAAQALRDAGVQAAFLQGGGSTSVAIGRRPDGERWSIELRPDSVANVMRVHIEDMAISISSNAERGHVIDPRTGSSADTAALAGCFGARAAETDAWATALLVSSFPSGDLGSILWRPSGWIIRPDPLPQAIDIEILARTEAL